MYVVINNVVPIVFAGFNRKIDESEQETETVYVVFINSGCCFSFLLWPVVCANRLLLIQSGIRKKKYNTL